MKRGLTLVARPLNWVALVCLLLCGLAFEGRAEFESSPPTHEDWLSQVIDSYGDYRSASESPPSINPSAPGSNELPSSKSYEPDAGVTASSSWAGYPPRGLQSWDRMLSQLDDLEEEPSLPNTVDKLRRGRAGVGSDEEEVLGTLYDSLGRFQGTVLNINNEDLRHSKCNFALLVRGPSGRPKYLACSVPSPNSGSREYDRYRITGPEWAMDKEFEGRSVDPSVNSPEVREVEHYSSDRKLLEKHVFYPR